MRLIKPVSVARLARRLAPQPAPTVAAIDLGSNSFHMIVARLLNGQLQVLDRIQETVRLAGGLDRRDRLDPAAQERALACLRRFHQRLHDIPPDAVRVVGTAVLRRARGTGKFLRAAERALGHAIEVISGQEEARLIYTGVIRNLPANSERRLVIDIGGGSTELIIGQGPTTERMDSLHIGCVGMSRRFFRRGELSATAFETALTAAHQELQALAAPYRALGWRDAVGSSGTIRAIGAIARAQGWTDADITPGVLARMQEALIGAGSTARLNLAGLSAERLPVLAGGFVVLRAAVEALGIERLAVSDSALREGLLYDLIGRLGDNDVRQQTIAALTERYHIDAAQATRVAQTAAQLFQPVRASWALSDDDGAMLAWAAHLHEIGLAIAHTKYHKHGAYLVEHSELPGFSYSEQQVLAALIRGHRRRFAIEVFAELPDDRARAARRACVLLRLAVLLHRSRADAPLPAIRIAAAKRAVQLKFPRGWLRTHALTAADLAQEAKYLRAARYRLEFE